MAIKSVFNSQKAYQGSVPEAETVKEAPERAAGGTVIAAEPVSAEKITGTPVISEKNPEQSDNGNGREIKAAGTEALKKAAEELKRNSKNSEAVFGVHDGTNRITIKIIDKDTKEVLKEYPPEKTLDMIAKVWEMAGLMVDEKR